MRQKVLEYSERYDSNQINTNSSVMGRTVTISEQINITLSNNPHWTIHSITQISQGSSNLIVVFDLAASVLSFGTPSILIKIAGEVLK